jgi:tight adherence protein B
MTVAAAVAAGVTVWLLLPAPPASVPARAGPAALWLALPGAATLLLPHAWTATVVLLGAAGGGARALWRRRAAARLAEQNAARMAEVCDLLAAELGAGRPAELALEEAAAAWPAVRPVSEVCRLGGDVPAAFRELSCAPGTDGLRLLSAAWAVSQRTGAGLASATRRVAETVRRDQATRRVVAGELASARATARLVACLPLVALLMGSGAGADPWSFLLATPWGLGCLAAGLLVGFLGLWWIELIAREVGR